MISVTIPWYLSSNNRKRLSPLVAIALAGLAATGCTTTGGHKVAAANIIIEDDAKAYAIFDDIVTDSAGYQKYLSDAGPIVASYGGRLLVAGPQHELLEGKDKPANLVVLEFPSMSKLHDWYLSKAYQDVLSKRLAASKVVFSIAQQGLPTMPITAGTASSSDLKGYAIFDDRVVDASGYRSSLVHAGPLVRQAGGRALVFSQTHEVLEPGTRDPANLVILEFPDMAHLNTWYRSTAYQPLKQQRSEAATTDFALAKEQFQVPFKS